MTVLRIASIALILGGGAFAQSATTFNGCPVFPANNVWNRAIDTLPVSASSADYVNSIGPSSVLRYDAVIGITVVPGTQPMVPINIAYPPESDPGPYPFPPNAIVEPGDQHVIVVDKDNCELYETYNSVLQPDGSWNVDSGAKWSLWSNTLRPATWTSADAAGLPIMPGLVRYEEILAGQITHAIRFTAPRTQRLYIWPARHYASTNTSAALPPMGARFRLKANFDISGFSPNVQVILRAMKKYGIILADNGLAWEMQFAADPRWNDSELVTMRAVVGTNLEAVDESGLMVNPDSGEAVQPNTPVTVTVAPASAVLSASQSQQFTATVTGSSLGVVWSLNPAVGSVSSSGLYTAPASVSATQTVTVTATLADGSKAASAAVTLQPNPPATLASVAVSPSSIVGGTNVSVTVTLTAAAPAAGAAVALKGSNAAFPSANVVVPANAIFQTFALPTSVVTANTAVTVTATYNGVSVSSSQLTVMPAVPPAGGASAAFLRSDTTTLGNWKGVYGTEGYSLINDGTSLPSYVTVTPSGYSVYTWAASTSDPRGLQKAASATDRIAACWYSSGAMSFDLNFRDTAVHQVAVYLVDWDNWFGRNQRVDILDASNNVLDTRSVTNFTGGRYLVWNLAGHVVMRLTNLNAPSNAVLSGLFFGAGTPVNSAPTAVFVKADTTTLGNWKGVYGADGYSLVGDVSNYPSYVTAAANGYSVYTWAASTTDPRGLQKAASATDRIAACWYSSGSFTIDLNFSGTATYQLALYVIDWDNWFGRTQRVDILDTSNNVLDTRPVANFIGGQYLVWNVSGHVTLRLTNTNPRSNAVISGIFFR